MTPTARLTALFSLAVLLAPTSCRPAADPTPLLLVLNKDENALAIIDPATQKVTARVSVGVGPHEVTTSADGRLAFVANYGEQQPGNTLSVIDVAAGKEQERAELTPFLRPHGLAESGGKIYFTAEVNHSVARYDPASNRVDWSMGTGQAGTHMLVVSPAGDRVYTADIGSNTVTAIDLTVPQGAAGVRHVAVGKGPEGIAVSPDGAEVWAGQRGGGISVIDTLTERVVKTIPGTSPYQRLQFTPDGKRVLVTDAPNGELVVFSAPTRAEEKRVKIGPGAAAILVTPDGARAFIGVIAENRVAVVDLATLTVTGSIATGKNPDGMAWTAPRSQPMARRPGSLGIAIAPISDELRRQLKLNAAEGVLVQQVQPGGPSAAAGLRVGDALTTANGIAVDSPELFLRILGRAHAGDTLRLQVLRAGERQTVNVVLAERPQP